MNESITLDTPEQINMWVLLSRRHQVQLHLSGLKVPGLLKSVNNTLGTNYRRVADLVVPIEFAISEAGGRVDYKLVNLHCMRKTHPSSTVFVDAGIYDSPADITDPAFMANAALGLVEVVLTTEPVRGPNGENYMTA